MTGKRCTPCAYPWRGTVFYTSGIMVRGSWLRISEAKLLRAKRERRRMARLFEIVLSGEVVFTNSKDGFYLCFATPEYMRREVELLKKGEL